VAGGAIAGVIVAFLSANDVILSGLKKLSFEHGITNVLGGALGYEILGVIFFAALGGLLYKVAKKK
jgi:hypothetical protein